MLSDTSRVDFCTPLAEAATSVSQMRTLGGGGHGRCPGTGLVSLRPARLCEQQNQAESGRNAIQGWGRSPGEGNGNPLQYSCLENPMDRGARWATVHGVTRVGHDLETKPPPPQVYIKPLVFENCCLCFPGLHLVSCWFFLQRHLIYPD